LPDKPSIDLEAISYLLRIVCPGYLVGHSYQMGQDRIDRFDLARGPRRIMRSGSRLDNELDIRLCGRQKSLESLGTIRSHILIGILFGRHAEHTVFESLR